MGEKELKNNTIIQITFPNSLSIPKHIQHKHLIATYENYKIFKRTIKKSFTITYPFKL